MKKLLVLLLLLCACAAKKTPPPDCSELFVLLPGNFIIDLAAGSEVWLDPATQEFALFCTVQDAKAALKRAGSLPGEWRIYRVAGSPGELARPRASGEYELARPAALADWIAD